MRKTTFKKTALSLMLAAAMLTIPAITPIAGTGAIKAEASVVKGINVYSVQWSLNNFYNAYVNAWKRAPWAGGRLVVDGICGPKTDIAIIAFQADTGLKPDGICGADTWARLRAYNY